MPRKKQTESDTVESTAIEQQAELANANEAAGPHALENSTQPNAGTGLPKDSESIAGEMPKHWGNPYESKFSCPEKGFELGEHRQYKQRVFLFNDKPSENVLATLKQLGFTYRANDKAWTIPADTFTRKLTDDLAREWAGPNYVRGTGR